MTPYSKAPVGERWNDPLRPAPVDRMLRDYYRREMPDPWPELRLPAARPAARSRRFWNSSRTYLALAASLLLLIFGLAVASDLLGGRADSIGGNQLPPAADKRFDDDWLRKPLPAPPPVHKDPMDSNSPTERP